VSAHGKANRSSNAAVVAPSGSWAPIDLRPAFRGDRAVMAAAVFERSDGLCLLPPGINWLFGDSGDGKSWVALIAAAQCLAKSRHVIWITYEDPNEVQLTHRLKLLGVPESQLAHLDFFASAEPLESGVSEIARLSREYPTALVVIDSLGEALALSDVNEDRDTDFAKWIRSTIRPLTDDAADESGDITCSETAVLLIDHSTKSPVRLLAPSGSKRKRATVTGLMLRLDVGKPLGRNAKGLVKLIVAKDRWGNFTRGQVAAIIEVDARVQPYVVTVSAPVGETARPRNATQRLVAVMQDRSERLTAEALIELVNQDAHTRTGEGALVKGTLKNALTSLCKAGTIDKRDVEGAAAGPLPSLDYALAPQ
jgi:hypothetical protein